MRNRIISAALGVLAASLVTAGPALAAPSVSVQVPPTASVNAQVNVVYSGMADTGVNSPDESSSMTLLAFYAANAPSCAPTVAAQRASAGAVFDGQEYIAAPAPFSFTSTLTFAASGTYRFCVYLEVSPPDDTAAPAAFGEAVVRVGGAPIPCTVPALTGLALAAATKKLTTAGCALGKVTKPRAAGKKKLVVSSQSKKSGSVLGHGTKINVVLKVKKAKR